ncbi:MAG: CBS domain-containing protein [bacterium]|nr:CBS domain-containing protein [bacterium]
MTTTDRLACKARDLMQTDVVCLTTTTSIPEAVRMLEEYRISGAPVLTPGGELAGVMTAFDIARSSHVDEGGIASQRNHYYLVDPIDEELRDERTGDEAFFAKDDYSDGVMGSETVGDWMNPSVISVGLDAQLSDVCKTMATERIHRVLVVDDGRVKGILSSLDIVRFLAIDE